MVLMQKTKKNLRNNVTSKKTIQDFFEDYKLLYFVIGFYNIKHPLYTVMKLLIFLGHLYIQAMSLIATCLVDKASSILSFHTFLIGLYSAWMIMSRVITDASLNRSRNMILSGIYYYEDEEKDEVETNIRQDAVKDIEKRRGFITAPYVVLSIYNLVFMPMILFLFSEDDGLDHTNDPLNKYLPYPVYMPFNTRTVIGYTAGLCVCVLYTMGGFGGGVGFISIYLSCALQLKAHLRILNHSVRNIQNRAYSMYTRKGHHVGEFEGDQLFNVEEFQNYMLACLSANVKHHQTLMKFHQEIEPFIGMCFFISAALGSVSYACSLYLLTEKDCPMNIRVSMFLTLFSELAYNYFICYVGQEIIDEASKLRESLYSTPWYMCNKRFSRVLDITMRNNYYPMKIRTVMIRFSASVEQFGDAMSGMYKIANLVRQ